MDDNTKPLEAGQVKVGGYIVIKNRPCKVNSISTSKTGKHGHAKCHFVATDIFTKKKYEMIETSTHNIYVPIIDKKEYTLLDISEEHFLTLLDDSGDTRIDVKMPNDETLASSIMKFYDNGDGVIIIVMKALNEEIVYNIRRES
ncbi:putative eukaryotic translation elongation factor 5A [Aureococcus anophagefferens virus]|uniref:Putative eukaryotic translation elongation factor 5A n=1 Tax=Aureococcus anophagefferens virus TaxID=1474867 RepID=A0A076FIC2_9VIRU|nr:putative eukaryotic translation elongation factor 5A [Aureococcus anophagefferens virus]AII17201.1 putative eukaryotic translation elongation factor 5A [Aureococcus anophagefferens virus]UOG94409.1 eukaryotic translation initiation factor [Aureococcus anophagefferens virus]